MVLVAYSRDGWIAPPAQISVSDDHHPIELVGFDSDEPGAVIVIGEDGHHLTLRVIAPETEAREAELALDVPVRSSQRRFHRIGIDDAAW